MTARFLLAGVLLMPAFCLAIDVRVVSVTPGRSADVVIGGGPPITLEVGEETSEGVRLLQANRGGAVLSVNGVTKTVPLVAGPPSASGDAGSGTVTLMSDPRGHFLTAGTVNGHSVRFLVDTGATFTTLSRREAQRIGLDYRRGAPTRSQTVNGVVGGWRVSLESVRLSDTTVRNVAAIVVDNDTLPEVLLGMSFLDRFDMQRRGATLVLRRRR